ATELSEKVKILEAELRPFRPLVEGLDEHGLTTVLSRAAEVAERERIRTGWRAEFERRISKLPNLTRMSGPVGTFARMAIAALAKVANIALDVDWRALENDSVRQIVEDGWTQRKAGEVIQEHSPGQVGRDPKKMAEELDAMADTKTVTSKVDINESRKDVDQTPRRSGPRPR
ncbi:hypothetical protein N5C29_25040, partial [Aeromonas caviae]|nr:hypothetical protein [Aeromonas caviae]